MSIKGFMLAIDPTVEPSFLPNSTVCHPPASVTKRVISVTDISETAAYIIISMPGFGLVILREIICV